MKLARTAAASGALAALAMLAIQIGLGGHLEPQDYVGGTGVTAMAAIGAFVAYRRPRNATGWLLVTAPLLLHLQATGEVVARSAFARHARFVGHLGAWLDLWIWMPAISLIAILLVVFPTGRALGRLWQWLVRVDIAFVVLACLLAPQTWSASTHELLRAVSPSEAPGGTLLGTIGEGPLQIPVLLGFVALVVRFVRSRGPERAQMKWFVFGSAVFAVSIATVIVLGVGLGVADPTATPFGAATLILGLLAIPVVSAIAILRHQLFDIDRIISRTVSYTLVTGLLVAAYLGLVLVFGEATRPFTGGSDLAVAASTLVVAAGFVPLRRRVQSAVDHRFNRARYDASRTLEAFTARLREQIDLDALGAELEDVVGRTMRPSHVSLWTRAER